MVLPRRKKTSETIQVPKTMAGGVLGALGLSWILVLYLFLSQPEGTPASTASPGSGVRGISSLPAVGLPNGAPPVIGTLEKIETAGRKTELVYAIPSANTKGIALLLHGCYHHGRKFFSKSESCESCVGLSEEMRIARILLEQKTLAVLSVTSHDRQSGCWGDKDFDHIKDALDYLRNKHHVSGPVISVGTSSGGKFGAQLGVRKIVDASMVGVMNLGPELAKRWVQMEKKPPLYFAMMPRDHEKVELLEQDLPIINGQGPFVVDKETCQSRPVDASYLNERVPGLTMVQAQAIVNDLVESGHIDRITGHMAIDPTGESNWREVLQSNCGTQGCIENQPLEHGQSALAKALNRAWAFHEYCSEVTIKALQYFEKELGGEPFLH